MFDQLRSPTHHTHDSVQTYCYESVRTAAIVAAPDGGDGGVEEEPNCFSVSPNGRFVRVFSSRSSRPGARQQQQQQQQHDDGDGGGGGASEAYAVRPGYVLPGLWDGHAHLIPYGEFLHSVNLFGADSPEEVRRRLREYLDANPGVGSKEEWGRGIGWDQMTMGGMPFAVSASSLVCLLRKRRFRFWLKKKKKGKRVLVY